MLIRLHREQGKPPRLEQVDPSTLQYEPGRRRVILFPGGGAWAHSDAKDLAGSIKYVEQTLASVKATNAPVDIVLYAYELPYEDYGAKGSHYAMRRNDLSHYGRDAAHFAVLPTLLGVNEKLRDLTPEMLKQRFSSLTMIGHSYGSLAIQDVADVLVFELRRLGWDEKTVADTMKELVTVSVAPIARADYPAPNPTQFFFTSVNDMTAIDSIRRENPKPADYVPMLKACGYKSMAEVMEAHGGELTPRDQLLTELKAKVVHTRHEGFMPKAKYTPVPSGYVLSAMLPDDEIRWLEQLPDGSKACRHLTVEDAKRNQSSVVHDYRTYLHGDHKLGECLINAVNNAVMREPGIGDGHQLLMTTELTRAQLHQRSRANEVAHVSERGIVR